MGRLRSSIKSLMRRLFNSSSLLQPRRRNVVVLGVGYNDWKPHLAQGAPVWDGLGGIASIDHVSDQWLPPEGEGWLTSRLRIVIPLLERNSESAPTACWGLVPSRAAIKTFRDKSLFARYARRHELTDSVPHTFPRLDKVDFPCILKRVDLAGGQGVVVVESPDALTARLSSPPWVGQKVVVQRYLRGPEWTGHVVAVDGRVVWSCAYAHNYDPASPIHIPSSTEKTVPAPLSAEDIACIERFLLPLRYDGPANVDFKRTPNGKLKILEINPRLGGSLFRPQNAADLKQAIGAIIKHAKWRGGSPWRQIAATRRKVADEARA